MFHLLSNTIKKNGKGIFLMILSGFMLASGQLIWKVFGFNTLDLSLGFVCYGMGAVCMIIAYRYGELSMLHPLMSFSYIFAIIYGFFYLGEPITIIKIIGLSIIIFGVGLIGADNHN